MESRRVDHWLDIARATGTPRLRSLSIGLGTPSAELSVWASRVSRHDRKPSKHLSEAGKSPARLACARCSNLHCRSESRVHVHVVCLRACSGAAESPEEIAPARIDHAYTRSSSLQISHTGYR